MRNLNGVIIYGAVGLVPVFAVDKGCPGIVLHLDNHAGAVGAFAIDIETHPSDGAHRDGDVPVQVFEILDDTVVNNVVEKSDENLLVGLRAEKALEAPVRGRDDVSLSLFIEYLLHKHSIEKLDNQYSTSSCYCPSPSSWVKIEMIPYKKT